MAMGRIIRKHKLNVSVGSTSFTPCHPDQKGCKSPYQDGAFAGYSYPGFANCLSACPFVLAAGTKRSVSLWSQVGIHQITTTVTTIMTKYETTYRVVRGKRKTVNTKVLNRKTTGSYTTTKLSKSQRRQVDRYFTQMGVDKTLVERMLAVSASDIVILKLRTNLSNTDWQRNVGILPQSATACSRPLSKTVFGPSLRRYNRGGCGY